MLGSAWHMGFGFPGAEWCKLLGQDGGLNPSRKKWGRVVATLYNCGKHLYYVPVPLYPGKLKYVPYTLERLPYRIFSDYGDVIGGILVRHRGHIAPQYPSEVRIDITAMRSFEEKVSRRKTVRGERSVYWSLSIPALSAVTILNLKHAQAVFLTENARIPYSAIPKQ